MGLVLPSVKGSANTCEEYQANILWAADLANATGSLDCAKISPSSLTTCLSANSVITTINTNINNNATAIGEVAQDLTDAQTALQTNINALTTLVNNQNTTIADQATQIATLISAFNALDSTVASFNSRLLSVEGRLTTLEAAIAAGIIVVWSGSIASIPVSYQLCNGQNSTPDLRDRFIVGAGTTYAVNAIGGANSHTHTISGTSGGTAITEAQMPSHGHGLSIGAHSHDFLMFWGGGSGRDTDAFDYGAGRGVVASEGGAEHISSRRIGNTNGSGEQIIQSSSTGGTTTNTGSNQAHTHTFSATTATTNNLPPYYALAYIMKV